MGKGGELSGGITRVVGRRLDATGRPNSRSDLYNQSGQRIQSRWYDYRGNATRNRDYRAHHGHPSPHDHPWSGGERREWAPPDWGWN